MQSVKDFMQSYFRESAEMAQTSWANSEPFRQKFFTMRHLEALDCQQDEIRTFEKGNPATILSVDESEASAVVTTVEVQFFGKRRERHRYHLESSGETWQIRRSESECFPCKGTGKRGGNVCKYCKGTGWQYYGPPGV